MKSLLFLALFFLGSFAQQFYFLSNTNVSLTNGNLFQFRNLQVVEVNYGPLLSGAFVASTSITANPTSATFDGLYGEAYVSLITPPTSWVLFVDAAAKFSGTPTNGTANVSASDAFIGSVFISLDELSPSGTVVNTILLSDLIWTIVDQSATGDVKYITLQGTNLIPTGFTVRITYLAASHIGVLNVGPVSVVTPKSIESVVNITNFPYKNAGDSVRLNIGVATQAATLLVTGQYTHLTGGSGNGATYFSLNNQAVVGGQVQPVKISGFVTATSSAQISNPDIVAQITQKYANAATFQLVSVTFTGGAASILYDPATGAGAPPPAIAAASSFTLPFALLFLLVALLL